MSIKFVVLVILALAVIEIFFVVYMILWGKSVQNKIKSGEVRRDEFEQPFLGSAYILYHFPVVIFLTVLSEKDETNGWALPILTFAVYVSIFLLVYKFILGN